MKPIASFVRHTVIALLGVLLLGLIWIVTHALADDARPAIGTRHVIQGAIPITYYALEPKEVSAKTETVVMVASLGRSVSDFNELRASLAEAGYRTLAIESRGIVTWQGGGFTRYQLRDLAADMHAAIADAGIPVDERVHIVGHAFGNRVARTFATLYPKQTAGLVLIAAGDKTDNMPSDVAHKLVISTLGFLPWFVREDAVTQDFFSVGNAVPEYWKAGWSTWGAIGQMRAARSTENVKFNAGGTGSMLVLQAENDVIAPPKDAGEQLKAKYGDRITLVIVPHAGHAQIPEQPAIVAQAILGFLKAHAAY